MQGPGLKQGLEKPALSFDVYKWPEFRAFCERLGLQWDLPTRDLVIRLPFDGLVTIEHEYRGSDTTKGKTAVVTPSTYDEQGGGHGPKPSIEFSEDKPILRTIRRESSS